MPSLESLPGDQRAVLQLVLARGRSYDEIARLLSINPSAVRERALAAVSTLGPQTTVTAESQAVIADYLLGQLPDDRIPEARDLLADSPSERAWARVVSSELASLAGSPLPEIPVERSADAAADAPAPGAAGTPASAAPPPAGEPAPAVEPAATEPPAEPTSPARGPSRPPGAEPVAAAAAGDSAPPPSDQPGAGGGRRSSRLGGIVVIVAAVVVVVVVVVILLQSGGSNAPKVASRSTTSTASTSTPTTSASTTSTTSSASSSTAAKVLAQVNLTPPSASSSSKAAGIAEVLSEGTSNGIAIVADHIPANTTKPPNAYAVWLYNSPTDAHILGFVNPGVGTSGRFSTASPLPGNAAHYKQLIVTLETTGQPKAPGQIVLEGNLSGL